MLTYGNLKLAKCVACFGMSAGINGSCPQSCKDCYALKLENLRPALKLARRRNYVLAQSKEFPDLVIAELKQTRAKIRFVRVHEGGEFFSAAYVLAWIKIAKQFPNLRFYAYTSLEGNKYGVESLRALPNFILIPSIMQDKKKNFGTLRELENRGYAENLCRGEYGECGKSCTYCMTPIAERIPPVFIKH